jgi:hypothetical protein
VDQRNGKSKSMTQPAKVRVDDEQSSRIASITASSTAKSFPDFPSHLFSGNEAGYSVARWSREQCTGVLRWSWNKREEPAFAGRVSGCEHVTAHAISLRRPVA